ncbi:MAG TPA: iron uptake protein [Ideonella sp.]|nr:iron uptake protein [Ideonella sp.]
MSKPSPKTAAGLLPGLRTTLRLVGAVFGGYALSAAWVALLAVGLPASTGMARSEAVLLAGMLGFVIYLAVLIWAFAVRSLARLWAVLGAGTALAVLLAGVLTH